MTRNMYDGINSLAAGIAKAFPNALLVAGYIDGDYAWTLADWALFPHTFTEHVTITVKGGNADVADVENGDMPPEQCEAWIAMRKASGLFRPSIYCSLSTVPAVRQGTGKYVLGRDYDLWVADYDHSAASVYPGAAAKQYESTAAWDLSVVYDDGWPHRTPPAPAPTTVEVNVQLAALKQGDSGQAVREWQAAGLLAHGYGYMIAPGSISGSMTVEQRAGVDGFYGSKTEAATKKFQADRHMAQTGTVGAAEWTAALA